MERLRIGNTDIILDDLGDGKGKIIISDTYGYNFSFYWGAMGGTLKDFLLKINESYFVGKLLSPSDRGVFSGRNTVKEVRRYIKEELSYELPWWKCMKSQKEMRIILTELEDCENEGEFINCIDKLNDIYYEDDKYDEDDFKSAMKAITCEPWHFIETEPSQDQVFLTKLFPKLQNKIRKS